MLEPQYSMMTGINNRKSSTKIIITCYQESDGHHPCLQSFIRCLTTLSVPQTMQNGMIVNE
jgi:hypothetical protein